MMASFGPGAMPASILFQQTNPKRAGSKSYDRYEQYKSATSYAEFLELGGSRVAGIGGRAVVSGLEHVALPLHRGALLVEHLARLFA